jgi:hypothetical protein
LTIKKDHSIDPIFNFTCYGESDESSKLLLKRGRVNMPLGTVCPHKTIIMAYNNIRYYFEVKENRMVEYPQWWSARYAYAYPYEVLSSFFTSQNLTPIWQHAKGYYGTFNPETGLWNGIVALVSRTSLSLCSYRLQLRNYIISPQVGYNQAHLGVSGITCRQDRITVVDCSHAVGYSKRRWITRFPHKITPATNLVRICDNYCWFSTFISIVSVSIFFVVAAKVGEYYGVKTEDIELTLVPFR